MGCLSSDRVITHFLKWHVHAVITQWGAGIATQSMSSKGTQIIQLSSLRAIWEDHVSLLAVHAAAGLGHCRAAAKTPATGWRGRPTGSLPCRWHTIMSRMRRECFFLKVKPRYLSRRMSTSIKRQGELPYLQHPSRTMQIIWKTPPNSLTAFQKHSPGELWLLEERIIRCLAPHVP